MKSERIIEIKQMGEKIADSISRFFNDPENLNTLKTLKSLGLKISNPDFESKRAEKRPFDGLTFVITGTLPEPRKKVEDLIESMGGHAASSVSKSTNYLVTGEEPGSKLKNAKELEVKIISYEELMEMAKEKG